MKIVYLFNRPGWAFHFEALYYLMYSSHEIILMLEDDIDKITGDIDIIVFPSAMHYDMIMTTERINKFRKMNIKIVAQYNSHKEIEFECYTADLIMASSKLLYNSIQEKYDYKYIIYQPHYVDSSTFFNSSQTCNSELVGWAGNFKNPFKRSHLLKQLDFDVKIKDDHIKSTEQGLFQEGMVEFYNNIGIYLCLSESEGTAQSVLEAMSCEKAVLSTPVGIVPELLNPLFIIYSKTDEDIIKEVNDKMVYLSKHPEVIRQEGKLNRQKIIACRDWESEVHKLDKIYTEALNNKSSSQFICLEPKNAFILEFAKHYDVEFVDSPEQALKSNKEILLWNPYGYLSVPELKWKYDLYKKCKDNDRPVYVMERGMLPNSIFIDKNGFLKESSSYVRNLWDKELSEERNIKVTQYIKDFISNDKTLEPQKTPRLNKTQFNNEIEKAKYSRVVFVPLQVPNDTVIKLWSGWTKDMNRFYNNILALAQRNLDILFLVKNHPASLNKQIISHLKNVKIVDRYHYKDCIEYSDIIVTVNSSVGLQSMMWKKPVIVCGRAFYYHDGLNYQANSISELHNLIRKAHKPEEELVKKFIHYLKYEFYTECKMEKTGRNSSKPLYFKNINMEVPINKIYKSTDNLKGNDMEPEKISVLIPAYNRVKWIEQSLRTIMKQTYKNLDIIVYDDGSTDRTVEIIESLMKEDTRIRLIRGGVNQGVSHARNQLLDLCNTRYACFHDTDDMSNVFRIELQYKVIKHKELLVFGAWDNMKHFKDEWYNKVTAGTRPFNLGFATVMFPVRKDIRFNTKLHWGEDWDWIDRMVLEYDQVEISERIYYINFHKDKLCGWRRVLEGMEGIDPEKMTFQEMQEAYRRITGKDVVDE